MRKADALTAHVDAAHEATRFWGVADCFLWPADWVVICGHADPAAEERGAYDSALGAARLVAAAGGVAALWAARAARSGLEPVARARLGDVGLLEVPADMPGELSRLIGAVHLGRGHWGVSTPRGVRTGRWRAVNVWRTGWPTR